MTFGPSIFICSSLYLMRQQNVRTSPILWSLEISLTYIIIFTHNLLVIRGLETHKRGSYTVCRSVKPGNHYRSTRMGSRSCKFDRIHAWWAWRPGSTSTRQQLPKHASWKLIMILITEIYKWVRFWAEMNVAMVQKIKLSFVFVNASQWRKNQYHKKCYKSMLLK